MRAILSGAEAAVLWGLFFGTSIYGHVALKRAVERTSTQAYAEVLWAAATDGLGWSAALAWSLSCVLWTLAVARQELMTANTISSLRFVLTGAAAWVWLDEAIDGSQALGMALIAVGIVLAR